MSSVHACDEDLVRRLPLPLAQLCRRAHNAKAALERHLTAYYLWEASLKLLASSAVVAYTDLGRPEPQIAERLKSLARPSLGHWWEFVRLLLPVLAERDEGFRQARDLLLGRTRDDLPRAAGLDACLREALDGQAGARASVRLSELFDRLVRYRNRELGHGAAGQAAPAVYERVGTSLLLGVTDVLGRLDVLAGRRLLYVAEVRRQASGDWLVEPYELTGESARRLPSEVVPAAAAQGLPHPERLYLGRPGQPGASLCPLHPLLTYDPETAEAFFLNARRGAQRCEYLCYTTGRVADQQGAGGDLPPLPDPPDPPPAPPDPAAAPRRLGEFEILSELGRGGMGVVYRAWQPSLGRQVALKAMLRVGDPKAEARFAREIRALGRVDHPGLVKVFTSGAEGDRWFYAMELIDGVSLSSLCDALAGTTASAVGEADWQRALTTAYEEARRKEKTTSDGSPEVAPPEPAPAKPAVRTGRGHVGHVVEIACQVAEAAQALHEAGVVHRDIKPDNVMLTPDGAHVVLMDLGLAQLADETEGRLTLTRQFIGTLRYASPEQVLAVGKVDRRSDVYSLGATLWELLTLRPLYGATEQTPTPELMRRIQYEEPEHVRKYNPVVPTDLDAIVLKCLEKNPAKRYGSAAGLAEDLHRFQNGEPVQARPVGEVRRLWRWCRRRPLVAGLTATILVLFVVAFALVFWQALRAEEKSRIAQRNAELAERNAEEARRNADRAEQLFQVTLEAANTLVDQLAAELKPIAGTRLATVASILRQAKRIYDKLPLDVRQRVEVREGMARMLMAFSDLYLDLGDHDLGDSGEALATATAARDIYAELLRQRDPANAGWRSELARSLIGAGRALGTRGDSNGALAAFRESLTLREALAAEAPADLDRQSAVAVSQSRLGNVLYLQGEMAAAKALYEKVLETRRRLAAADRNNLRWQKDLVNAHLNMGDVHWAGGDVAGAVADYQEAAILAERLVRRDPDNLDWLDRRCNALIDLGGAHLANGDRGAALDALKPAQALAQRQTSLDPRNANWAGLLLYASASLADIRADTSKPVEDLNAKKKLWEDFLVVCERRVREDPADAVWLTRRAACHRYLGLCYAGLAQAGAPSRPNLTSAARDLEVAVEQGEALAKSDPDNRDWANNLERSLAALADVYRGLQEVKKATETELRAARVRLAFRERVARRSPDDPARRRDVALAYQWLANTYFRGQDYGPARDYDLKAQEIQQALAAENRDNVEYQRDLGLTHWYLGVILEELGDTAGSLRHRRQAVDLREQVARHNPDNMAYQAELVVAYDHLVWGLRSPAALSNVAQSTGVPPRPGDVNALAGAWQVWEKVRPTRARLLRWRAASLFRPDPPPAHKDVSVSGGVSLALLQGRSIDDYRSGARDAEALYRTHRGRIDKALELIGSLLDLAAHLDVRQPRGAAEAPGLLRRAESVLLRAKQEQRLTGDEEGLFDDLAAALKRLPPDPGGTAQQGGSEAPQGHDYGTLAWQLVKRTRAEVLDYLGATAGDGRRSIALLRWLLALDPKDVAARRKLVIALGAAWRWEEAAREQERLIRDLGKEAPASDYELLAELQLGLGQPERAAESFRAAKHDTADPAARLFTIRVAWQQRRFEEVRRAALQLTTDPKATTAQKQQAEAWPLLVEMEAGALADAEAGVRKALAAAPEDVSWLWNLAYVLAEQGKNLDEAETSMWKALVLNSDDPRARVTWGWIQALQDRPGNPGLAIMEKLASHELLAHDPVFFQHLGDVYRLAGRTDRAREAWQKSLRLFPKTTAPDDHRKRAVEDKLKQLAGA
jgi:serine/threonine protein kinase/tetratricopeptide (TPR) repeat protein